MYHAGSVQDGTSGRERMAAAVRFQFARPTHDVIGLLAAVAVERRMVAGVDLDDAKAERHRVEAGLGVDELEILDGAAGLLHRRAVEPFPGRDDYRRSILISAG